MLNIRPLPSLVQLLSAAHFSLYERCLYGGITAFVIGIIIGPYLIRMLSSHRIRQVFRTRQQVRDLAVLHESKSGVPTMGGLIIFIASILSVAFWVSLNDLVLTSLIVYLACTLLGALDDTMKIIRGNSKGVTSRQKLFAQAILTILLLYFVLKSPPLSNILTHVEWKWFLEMFSPRTAIIAIGVFYFFVISGTSNAVNLTDGIDGLAITNILMCFLFFAVIGFNSCDFRIVDKSLLTYMGGASEIAVMCSCFAGGCAAFCLFNLHPASIFMGDTGSIGLGGLLAIVAILLRQPFSLLLVGLIFVVESLSVMLQVATKKLFGKRVFLMSPLHHHFELKGYSERRIVKVAVVIQGICLLAAFGVIFYGCL